jgi:hypothetical protein
LQSSTGTHSVLPSAARVAPVQAVAGRIAVHPHPFAAVSKPAGHVVGPTGSHVPVSTEGIVPGAQAAGAGGGVAGCAVVSSVLGDEHP